MLSKKLPPAANLATRNRGEESKRKRETAREKEKKREREREREKERVCERERYKDWMYSKSLRRFELSDKQVMSRTNESCHA